MSNSKTQLKKVSVKSKKTAPLSKVELSPTKSDRVDWYSLYIYAICLVTILICIFSLVSLVRGIVDSVWPDPGYIDPYNVPQDGELTSAQIKQNLEEQNQRQAIKGIVNSFTTLLISGPIYLYHWNLARKNRS
jgi:hypothetical protein